MCIGTLQVSLQWWCCRFKCEKQQVNSWVSLYGFYLYDISGVVFSLNSVGEVRDQGTVWMHRAPHAESHQRDLTRKHLEGRVLRSDLFLFQASRIIFTSQRTSSRAQLRPKALRSRKWSARTMSWRGLRVPWEGSCQSAVHTLCCLCLSWARVSYVRQPDRLGLSHYISVCAEFLTSS